jgi:hypothetical protein
MVQKEYLLCFMTKDEVVPVAVSLAPLYPWVHDLP